MSIHFFFDILAYVIGTFLTWRVFLPKQPSISNINIRYAYYTCAILGAVVGAVLLGSLNLHYSVVETRDTFLLGKSILGAMVGGVISIEIFKKAMNIEGSTGAYFVPSLSIGIAVGRLGCFFTGLEDYTYGVETNFIFAYDFGDGVFRHPVQLYESFIMFIFFLYVLYIYFKDRNYFEKHIFYEFILLYSIQRFLWEFLKPYETIALGLNVFHFFCLGLMVYSLYFLQKVYYDKG